MREIVEIAREHPEPGEWKGRGHRLAVEEQFYLLFPLLLMLLWRVGKRRIFSLLAAAAIPSLGLAQWASIHAPVAAFYFLPTRAWEWLLGALVSLSHFETAP